MGKYHSYIMAKVDLPMMKYIKVHDRVLVLQDFPEGICIQQVAKNGKPNLGAYLCYPYEKWMDSVVDNLRTSKS